MRYFNVKLLPWENKSVFLRKLFLIGVCLAVSAATYGGNLKVEWLTDSINLGLIPEEGGMATAIYNFVNKGNKSVKIRKVVLSCGCTDASYPDKEVEKGDTAAVTLTFNPEDRIGKFKRSTVVYFENLDKPFRLILTGNVVPSQETLSLMYPYYENNIFFDRINVDFGEVERGVRQRNFVEVYNGGEEIFIPVMISETDGLTWTLDPPELSPGEKALLTIYLDSSRLKGFGRQEYLLTMKQGEDKETIIKILADIKVK